MKTRNKFQLFWLNRSNSWFKSKNGSFWWSSERTIDMNTSIIHMSLFLFSYMLVTCIRHYFRGIFLCFGWFRVAQLHASYMLVTWIMPARHPSVFFLKSSARRSCGFAIRCQKMFDHFPLGICNPHPLYLYFILKQSQEWL